MLYVILLIFVVSLILYILYNNFTFQIFLHQMQIKSSFINSLTKEVNGKFYKKAYFARNHKIVSISGKDLFYSRHKLSFSTCYNCVTFKTPDASWELFFSLVKNGPVYSEIMSLRAFPNGLRIKSEGTVEKSFSKIHILTNNRYLTDLLESKSTQEYLDRLLQNNEDILLVSPNMLHFKCFVDSRKMSNLKTLNSIKLLNVIKNQIYKKGVIEY